MIAEVKLLLTVFLVIVTCYHPSITSSYSLVVVVSVSESLNKLKERSKGFVSCDAALENLKTNENSGPGVELAKYSSHSC
jgi:hypothetical protein